LFHFPLARRNRLDLRQNEELNCNLFRYNVVRETRASRNRAAAICAGFAFSFRYEFQTIIFALESGVAIVLAFL
jgi:hypothetical protein